MILFRGMTSPPADTVMAAPWSVDQRAFNQDHGVLSLTLRAGCYDWRFLTVKSGVVDSGSGTCHGAPRAGGAGNQRWNRSSIHRCSLTSRTRRPKALLRGAACGLDRAKPS